MHSRHYGLKTENKFIICLKRTSHWICNFYEDNTKNGSFSSSECPELSVLIWNGTWLWCDMLEQQNASRRETFQYWKISSVCFVLSVCSLLCIHLKFGTSVQAIKIAKHSWVQYFAPRAYGWHLFISKSRLCWCILYIFIMVKELQQSPAWPVMPCQNLGVILSYTFVTKWVTIFSYWAHASLSNYCDVVETVQNVIV